MAVEANAFDTDYFMAIKSDPMFYNCHEYTIIKNISPNGEYSENCLDNMKILILGCGPAAEIPHYISKGASNIIGIDIDPKMVQKARENLYSLRIEYSKASIFQGDCFSQKSVNEILPLEIYHNYFDAATDFWLSCCAISTENLDEEFKIVNTMLKLGGIYAFVAANPKEIVEYNRFQTLMSHDFYYTLKNLTESCENGRIEIAFIDTETRREKFSFIQSVWSLQSIRNLLERNGFELIEAKGFEANPNFDISKYSQYTQELICGENSEGFCYKARKVSEV